MKTDFDKKIDAAEEGLRMTISEMEQAKEVFSSQAVDFLKPFWFEHAESIVKNEPEVTKNLGKDGLSRLKSEVKALEDNTQRTRFLIH
jgi:hypothetical protein